MYWQHQVSEDWLKARQTALTATDIKKLTVAFKKLPKTRDKSTYLHPAFAVVWGEKHSQAALMTDSPTQAAARGHVLEPYAVEAWNYNHEQKKYYHWDDALIVNEHYDIPIGFSPDAMSVTQDTTDPKLFIENFDGLEDLHIMEVKSYTIQRHYEKGINKNKLQGNLLDERLQIAFAMCVMPTIKDARLVLYNPEALHPIFSWLYKPEDLEKEIDLCLDIIEEYARQAFILDNMENQIKLPKSMAQIEAEVDKLQNGLVMCNE